MRLTRGVCETAKPRFCVECDGHIICDFCRHHSVNQPEHIGKRAVAGFCHKHSRPQDQLGGCDNFECWRGAVVGWR